MNYNCKLDSLNVLRRTHIYVAQEQKLVNRESNLNKDYSYVKKLPHQSRNILAKEFKLCFNCYSKGHTARDCTEAQGKEVDIGYAGVVISQATFKRLSLKEDFEDLMKINAANNSNLLNRKVSIGIDIEVAGLIVNLPAVVLNGEGYDVLLGINYWKAV
ncbi:hypothetical protein CONCODRAFT_13698 [Conidiobolus coronatus NRRL 28638]|uniref:CCHC-type domain-containing protein n=1 Tax=Conidiobolus coronatus (strain ATCC 28846 / CBS 209.66 / NRRL 28638) TaxID=796925 RepID=A0A137NQ87_CONC2|nr:hypothetical protein CONCODRAFT_13698 [Conidiobolus coronatus NRRL 28638]|eukprot:KXN64912.1 hypothetical protein CONCODRAFT_13698 [Conidiobolus coronatus NRRL 28638]